MLDWLVFSPAEKFSPFVLILCFFGVPNAFLKGWFRCSNLLLEKGANEEFDDAFGSCDVGGIGDECFASFKCSVKDARE